MPSPATAPGRAGSGLATGMTPLSPIGPGAPVSHARDGRSTCWGVSPASSRAWPTRSGAPSMVGCRDGVITDRHEGSVELRDYVRILRRRWLLILGMTMVGMAVAALITTQQTKQYTSTARVFISTTASSSSDALQGSQFPEQRVASYAD